MLTHALKFLRVSNLKLVAISATIILALIGAFAVVNASSSKAMAEDSNAVDVPAVEITIDNPTSTGGATASLGRDIYVVDDELIVNWKGGTSGSDFVLPTRIKYGNITKNVSELISVDQMQDQNTEYLRRMSSDGNMTTYETLSAYATQSHSVSLGKVASLNTTVEITWQVVRPVYRMYNMVTSEHLFTTQKTEYDNFVSIGRTNQDYWIGEGISWLAPTTGTTVERYYNAGLGAQGHSSHYYSSDAAEIANLKAAGWTYDSGCDLISGGSTPIYTCYNEALGSAHHYTSSKTEWESLEANGWALERDKNGIEPAKSVEGVFQGVVATSWNYSTNYYKVNHVIEGANSAFATQWVSGTAGQTTAAQALSVPGYEGTASSATISSNNSTVVSVNYTKANYQLKLNFNQADQESKSTAVKYAEAMTPETPSANGQVFKGWYYDSNFTKPFVAGSAMPAGDVRLFAQWEDENTGGGETPDPDQGGENPDPDQGGGGTGGETGGETTDPDQGGSGTTDPDQGGGSTGGETGGGETPDPDQGGSGTTDPDQGGTEDTKTYYSVRFIYDADQMTLSNDTDANNWYEVSFDTTTTKYKSSDIVKVEENGKVTVPTITMKEPNKREFSQFTNLNTMSVWTADEAITTDTIILVGSKAKTYTVKFEANGGSGVMGEIQKGIEAGETLPANVFTNGNKGFLNWNTQADGKGTSYADKTTSELSSKQGDVVTLYAQWTTVELGDYWIGIASKYIDENGNTVSNPEYSKPENSIVKTASDIQNDITKMNLDGGYETLKIYESYMNSDKYHLYTKVAENGNEDDYVEFRIVQVGAHNRIADGGGSDSSKLTFQAIHSLASAGTVFDKADTTGGWASSSLFTSMNSDSYAGFKSGLTDKITSVKKWTRASVSVDSTASESKFWIMSYSELVAGKIDRFSKSYIDREGATYSFWASKNLSLTDANKSLKSLGLTRSGNSPAGAVGGFEKGAWALRSLPGIETTTKMMAYVGGDGVIGGEITPTWKIGIVPCFCF